MDTKVRRNSAGKLIDEKGRFVKVKPTFGFDKLSYTETFTDHPYSGEELTEALRELEKESSSPIEKALRNQRKAFDFHYRVWLIGTCIALLLEFFAARQ